MKFFRNISRLILLLALPLLAGGCSDVDFGNIWSDSEEGNVTVVLPSFTAFTRAGSTELNISTLYFFAFPQEGEGELFVTDLAKESTTMQVVDSYNRYTLDLKPGKYKFYIAANYFNTGDNLNSITEDELKVKEIVYTNSFDGSKPEAGLPMSCDHTGFKASKDGEYFTYSFEIESGKQTTLYADMVFDVAKVSLTLNDGLGEPLKIKGIKAEKFSENVPLFKQDFSDYGSFNPTAISLDRKGAALVEEISSVGDGSQTDAETEGDENSVSSLDLSRYHGETVTFYVPERIVDNADNQSKLTITAGGDETAGGNVISLLLGDDGKTDSDPTTLPEETERKRIDRGVHYSYTINVKGEITLAVQLWTPVSILYNLHGPVFLHVEKTVIPAAAGESTTFWYDSNAKPVEIDEKYSPVYTVDGEEVPFYILDNNTYPDSLIVSVNPLISPQQLTDNERKKYNYFYLKAGNLRKKIDVIPLKLEPFLNVDPLVMTIDARERIASGAYEGHLEFTVSTNLSEITVTRGDEAAWKLNDSPNPKALTLTEADREVAITSSQKIVVTGTKKLWINYDGINSGWEFWKAKRQLTLTVSAVTKEGKTLSKKVTINIVNNIQNYTIHFRPTIDWALPHIYVYQCLEFPGDLVDKNGVEYSKLRNKPVGADGIGNTAALEYSFTGKIAFKGWYVGANDPYRNTDLVNGFYYFTDDVDNSKDEKPTSWAPGQSGFTTHYYDNMDFCSEHREMVNCQDCRDSYNKLWPGINMLDEGNGWWKFELTGIATPGKALIMFADSHGGDNSKRYPAIRTDGSGLADPGIPLFDYPDKEGWFDLFNGSTNFVSSKPVDPTGEVIYRIYWYKDPEDSEYYRDYIQYNDGETDQNSGKVRFQGSEYINDAERFYYDLKVPSFYDDRFVTANNANNSNLYPYPWISLLSNRVRVQNDKYHYYVILY